MGSNGIANEGQCDLSEMPGSTHMDLSLVGAGLVWFLADLRLEQVSLVACQFFTGRISLSILNFQATIWFCVFYAIGFALT